MISLWLVAIAFCMLASAFFSGIETGVISIHRMRLRHFVRKGSLNARILEGFVEDFDRLLGTTLVGNNICVVIISIGSASLATQLMGNAGSAVSSVVTGVLALIFCEYIPKAWFHARPLERSQRFAGLLRVAEIIFTPISFATIRLARLLAGGGKQTFEKADAFVTREDLKVLAREGEKDGVLSTLERDMIQRVIELERKSAAQIMVPRDKMVTVTDAATIEDVYATAREKGFTRMPVIAAADASFVGIVNVFYLLSTNGRGKSVTAKRFMRPPLFINVSMPVDDILPRLRAARQPMSLVVDDEHHVVGMITTEDVLSAIVGQLHH